MLAFETESVLNKNQNKQFCNFEETWKNLKTENFAKKFTEFRMTFDSYKEIIEENDTVILYISFNTMHALTVTPTKVNKKGEENEHIYQCSYGGLIVKDLIGKRYGTRVQLSKVW